MPDPGDQCGRDVDDRVLRTGGRGDAHPGPPDRGRDPGPHLAGAQRERQLLRLNCGRRRTRAGQARPVPAIGRCAKRHGPREPVGAHPTRIRLRPRQPLPLPPRPRLVDHSRDATKFLRHHRHHPQALGHRNLQTTLRYAEQSDAVADAELRAWRRRAIQGHRHLAEPYPLFVRDYSGPPRRSAIRASSSSQGA